MEPNPMNPENIEVGDTVSLRDSEGRNGHLFGKLMIVRHISGRFMSKIHTDECDSELNAQCFQLVSKGKK